MMLADEISQEKPARVLNHPGGPRTPLRYPVVGPSPDATFRRSLADRFGGRKSPRGLCVDV